MSKSEQQFVGFVLLVYFAITFDLLLASFLKDHSALLRRLSESLRNDNFKQTND